MYPFAIGVIAALALRRLGLALAVVVLFFVLHSALRATGAFGSAGYPRYFVCVAPAIGLLMLLGWNAIATGVGVLLRRGARPAIAVASAVVLGISALSALCYVDDMPWTRDSRMVDDLYTWYRSHREPATHYAFSQAYMCILFDCDPQQRVVVPGSREQTVSSLRDAPPQTLVFWDADTGPDFFGGITGGSIIAMGYRPLRIASDTLRGRILPHLANGRYIPTVAGGWGRTRVQRMWLLYR